MSAAAALKLDIMDIYVLDVDSGMFGPSVGAGTFFQVLVAQFSRDNAVVHRPDDLISKGTRTMFRTAAPSKKSRSGRKELDAAFYVLDDVACPTQAPVDVMR